MAESYSKRNTLYAFEVSSTAEVNWAQARALKLTLTGDTTIRRFLGGVNGESLTLVVVQDSVGSRTITWPASVVWIGGDEPTLTEDADAVDVFQFFKVDETYQGSMVGSAAVGVAPPDAYAPGGDDVAVADGGTGLSTAPTGGQLLIGTAAGGYVLGTITEGPNITITNGDGTITIEAPAPSAVLADGDYGDITATEDGDVLTIDNGVVTTAKMGGDVTPAGKNLLTAADEAAQLTALGIDVVTVAENEIVVGAASGPGVATTPTEYLAILKVERSHVWQGVIVADGDDAVIADGVASFAAPPAINGMNVTNVQVDILGTAGTTGTMDVQLRRVRAGSPVDVLSTKATVDSTETSSATGTAMVVNASNDDAATGDHFFIDVDAVHTTEAVGPIVASVAFQLP
jgi:hypothetical protein